VLNVPKAFVMERAQITRFEDKFHELLVWPGHLDVRALQAVACFWNQLLNLHQMKRAWSRKTPPHFQFMKKSINICLTINLGVSSSKATPNYIEAIRVLVPEVLKPSTAG
jgi:hypothetical protein